MSGESWAMLTDLYELTMAFGYWKLGLAQREAVFHLTFREHPFRGSFSIACGLHHLGEMLADYRFTAADVSYLETLRGADNRPLFSPEFLTYLSELRLTCDIDAVEEGTVVFPNEPLVRVRGPLLQAQILESLLLNVINFQTLVATKAARIVQAAGTDQVLEFGLRRAQGESGAMVASRAAYIGGCAATSNVLAGRRYGIPVRGTHAHSWVSAFEDELTAFEAYAGALPNNCIFLVDTYDTQQGIRNAIRVARQLRQRGHSMVGIRLDSGDLADLSKLARRWLDEAEMHDALIVASNDLDEYEIASLREAGARIDVWGVGTRLATAFDQPALGGVYKLSALRDEHGAWQYKMKMSEQALKMSVPGILQTRRFLRSGMPVGDIIYDAALGIETPAIATLDDQTIFEPPADSTTCELLVPVFRAGKLVYPFPTIHQSRARSMEATAFFRRSFDELHSRGAYPVGLEPRLDRYRRKLVTTQRGKGS